MRVALIVFDALRTFDRPATRRELERESGLDYDQVHEGLRTLNRAGLLLKDVEGERRRGLYQLISGAVRPVTARGHYPRDTVHRQQVAALVRARRAGAAVPTYSPARPPSHAAAPGTLRIVVKGILDVRHPPAAPFSPCALAKFWKPY